MNHSSTNAISSNISVPNIQSTSSNATLNYQHILNEIQQQLKHPLSYQDLLLLLDQVNKLQIQQQTQALAQQIQAQIFALSRGAPSLPTQPMYLPDNPLGHLLTPLSQPSPFPYTIPTTGIISRVNPLISSTPLINPSTLTNILPNTSTTIPSYFRSNMESNLSGNIQLAPSLSTRNSAPIITPPIQSSNKLSKPFVTPTSQVESEDIFSLDILNTKNDNAINSLYFAFPLQCKSCGLRFLDRETMNPHLDWHFQQNKKQKEKSMKASSRNWYLIKQVRKFLKYYYFFNK